MNLKPRLAIKPANVSEEKEESTSPVVMPAEEQEEAIEQPSDAAVEVDDAIEVDETEGEVEVAEKAPAVEATTTAKKKLSFSKEAEAPKKEEETTTTSSRFPTMSRPKLIESFTKLLKENLEGFENTKNEESKAFLELIEEWLSDTIINYNLKFAGFYFGHYKKPYCFREPGSLINYISEHEEIKAAKQLNVIKKVCQVLPDGTFVAGDKGKDAKGEDCVIPNKQDTIDILPKYEEHLARCLENLEKEDEKSNRRKTKIMGRAKNIL